jgi:uncharacterized protein YcfJ
MAKANVKESSKGLKTIKEFGPAALVVAPAYAAVKGGKKALTKKRAKANVKETGMAGKAAAQGGGAYLGYKGGGIAGKALGAGIGGAITGDFMGAVRGARIGQGIGQAGGAYAGYKAGKELTKDSVNPRRESTDISNFLKSLTEKNYAEANKYLHAVLDTKMKSRIRDTATN